MPTVLGVVKTSQKDNTAPTSLKVGETKFGKDISISRCKSGRMFQIDVSGGGTKPVELTGHYTSWTEAENAVRFYVDSGNGRVAEILKEKQSGDSLPPLTDRPKLKME